MNNFIKDRDFRIDILRCLGLLSIILAHVSPPFLVFQLRSFDVPLMVFVSGMSFVSSGKVGVNLGSYMLSRVKRLLFPMWAFLIIFFSCIYLFEISTFNRMLNVSVMLDTFIMNGGIGYVWVIRIFLIIALLSPLYVMLTRNIRNDMLIVLSLLVVFSSSAIYNLILKFSDFEDAFILKDVVMPAVSYGVLFVLGCRYKQFSTSERKLLFVSSLISIVALEFSVYLLHKEFSFPQGSKYPPELIYILYPMMIIPVLDLIAVKMVGLIPEKFMSFIVYISSNTIWIYFLHIPVVEYFRSNGLPGNFITRWVIAVVVPIAVYYLQRKLVLYLSKKTKNKPVATFIKQTFTG